MQNVLNLIPSPFSSRSESSKSDFLSSLSVSPNFLFFLFFPFLLILTLFETGGAFYAPNTKIQSAVFPWSTQGSPKLLTLFLSVLDIFQQSRFSNFQFFKKNIKRCQKYPKGGPFCEFQIFGVLARNSVFLMA